MRSIAFADFLIGVGILFVLEGLLFAASPAWMRRAMKSALATPDNILRVVGIGSAVAGLIFLWLGRPYRPVIPGRAPYPADLGWAIAHPGNSRFPPPPPDIPALVPQHPPPQTTAHLV